MRHRGTRRSSNFMPAVQVVAGSNPISPTKKPALTSVGAGLSFLGPDQIFVSGPAVSQADFSGRRISRRRQCRQLADERLNSQEKPSTPEPFRICRSEEHTSERQSLMR